MRYPEAKIIVGNLSRTTKMPGLSWGIPAVDAHWVPDFAKKHGLPVPPKYGCPMGAKLANIEGSVCKRCYARKGNYTYPNARKGMINRLNGYSHPDWVEAMAIVINTESETDYFRWFDSGDLFDIDMLKKIIEVCKLTPEIKHWLPTRELAVVKALKNEIPDNLTIRVSAIMVGDGPIKSFDYTSTVHAKKATSHYGVKCPAPDNNGCCGRCRQCWEFKGNISYRSH